MSEALSFHVLDSIPFEPDLPKLYKRLHIREGSPNAAELDRLLTEATPLAHPHALFLPAYLTGRGEDWVEIESKRFTSRVLRVNLDQTYRVFPYLATCGPELQAWADDIDDMLLNYWAEAIKESALHCASRALNSQLAEQFHLNHFAEMNPGSLKDWPIQQQRVLFDLFGGNEDRIGVRLTDTMLMIPTKTVSGIRFPTQVTFESCQLCPREDCPGRRAPYDPALFENRYGLPV